jgi:hypothetical protein
VPRDLHTTTEMIQHSAFLGMSRGLRSHTRNVPQTPGLQRSPPAGATAFLSPFATQAQTQFATVMRTASQRPEENPDDYT